jgi:hypothetical protein
VRRRGTRHDDALPAIVGGHQAAQAKPSRLDPAKRGDRGSAAATQSGQEGPLGISLLARHGVFEGRKQRAGGRVRDAALHGQRPLSGRREHLVRLKTLGHQFRQAKASDSRSREDDRIEPPRGDLTHPRVDIATQGYEIQVRAKGPQLGAAAGAAGAHHGTLRQGREGPACSGEQGIPGVLPTPDGGEDQACGEIDRNVLQGVDGEVDLAAAQGVLQGVGEDAAAPERRERRGDIAVPPRGQYLLPTDEPAMGSLETPPDERGLPARQCGGPGSKAEDAGSNCHRHPARSR